jgi:hypothetical protein
VAGQVAVLSLLSFRDILIIEDLAGNGLYFCLLNLNLNRLNLLKMSMLIIKACGTKGEENECRIIQEQAKAYGLSTRVVEATDEYDLEVKLQSDDPCDFIYVSSHGDEYSMCNESRTLDLSWIEFGTILCESGNLKSETIIILSCCRGGLKQVAYKIFHSCPGVRYVVGPITSQSSEQLHICYANLIYSVVCRDMDPVVACRKIEALTDIRLFFSDRLEVETEYGFKASLDENLQEIHNYQIERLYLKKQELQRQVDTLSAKVPTATTQDLTTESLVVNSNGRVDSELN